MKRSAGEFAWIVGLALSLCPGCAPAPLGEPREVQTSTVPGASDLKTTNVAVTDPAMDPFWNGLERHEIPLAQTLLLVKGSRGIAACPYLNVEMFEKTGEACVIIPAARIDGMLESKVTALTPKARELGIEIGMPGREALDKIR